MVPHRRAVCALRSLCGRFGHDQEDLEGWRQEVVVVWKALGVSFHQGPNESNN